MVSRQCLLEKFGQRAKCVLIKWLIRIWHGVFRLRIGECGLGISDWGFRIGECGLWISDWGFRIGECGFKIKETGVRDQRSEVGGQRADDRGQLFNHLASASLGHYAGLSFVVMGRSEIINAGYWIF
jgi:hypothetical protein